MSRDDDQHAQDIAPPGPLLERVRNLIYRHDKILMLNMMDLEDFCNTPETGLVSSLIVLDDSADEIGFDYQDKERIREMIEEVPKMMRQYSKVTISPAEKDQIDREVRRIIGDFIRKPCKTYVRKYTSKKAPLKEKANVIGTTIKGEYRDAEFEIEEIGPAVESRLQAGETLLNKMDKVKKFSREFLELTGLLLDLRIGVHLCITLEDKYAPAIAMGWVQSCANFKRNQTKLLSDIRNEIPDIPGNEWERLSAIDAKLSEHIDKLIYDFNNITDRKRDINSTMDNLRREYRSLWIRLSDAVL